MKIVCQIGGHRRSVRRARFDSVYGWRSRCIFCGERMVRSAEGEWRLQPDKRSVRADSGA